jgi:Tfp pilus assembly protein PilV
MTRRPAARRRCRGEGGFTLTEALAALIILGVAVFGIVTAMGASIVTSDVHRKNVTADAVLKSWAERLNSIPYQECATEGVPQYQPSAMSVNVPTGYTASIATVRYWNGDGATDTPATFSSTCPGAPDNGVQQLTLQVRSADGRGTQQLTILKRRL